MNSSDSIEVSAPTVDQAISQALQQLGALEDDVAIEVLSTPRAGVFGLGARQARVRVTRQSPPGASSTVQSPPPAPPQGAGLAGAPPKRPAVAEQPQSASSPASFAPAGGAPRPQAARQEGEAAAPREDSGAAEQGRTAVDLLRQILELMGAQAEVRIAEQHDEEVELELKGDGSGLLIGKQGQTLDALEYLLNRFLARRVSEPLRVRLDTEAYRERRRRQIERLALAKGEQAKREHTTVRLDPMSPRDRRIVHLALQDDPLITTRSTGEGFLKTVEIVWVENPQQAPSPRRAAQPADRRAPNPRGGPAPHG